MCDNLIFVWLLDVALFGHAAPELESRAQSAIELEKRIVSKPH